MAMQPAEIEALIKSAMPDAMVTIEDLAGDGDHGMGMTRGSAAAAEAAEKAVAAGAGAASVLAAAGDGWADRAGGRIDQSPLRLDEAAGAGRGGGARP